jgi:hexosaminidase
MKKLLVLALLAIQGIAGAMAAEVSIMPQPVKLEIAEGELAINSKTTIILMDNSLKSTAEIFADDMAVFFDSKPLKVSNSHRKATNKSIFLSLKSSLAAEAYELYVNTNGVLIEGGSAAGVFYGLQSLRQLARNMVWLMRKIAADNTPRPAAEERVMTNFIR